MHAQINQFGAQILGNLQRDMSKKKMMTKKQAKRGA